MPSKGRGFTLLEVTVASFLAIVLLTVLARLFTVSGRIGREEVERAAAEAVLTSAVQRWQTDLQRTVPGGVTLSSDGARTLIHPAGTVTERRQLMFEPSFVYWSFDASQNRLYRSTYRPSAPPDPLSSPIRLKPADLTALPLNGANGGVLNRYDGIMEARVENPSGVDVPNVGTPLKIVVAAKVTFADTRSTVKLEKEVRLRMSAY